MSASTITPGAPSAVYAVQPTDKMLAVALAPNPSYDQAHLVFEYSTGGASGPWSRMLGLLQAQAGQSSQASAYGVDLSAGATQYVSFDLSLTGGITHVRVRAENFSLGGILATFTPQAWGLTAASKQNAPGNIDGAVLNLASAARAASGDSGPINVAGHTRLLVAANVSAITGTSPTIQFFVDYLGADGVWYNIASSSSITAAGQYVSSIGSDLDVQKGFGNVVRFRWVIGGTGPSATFSASMIGQTGTASASY